MFSKGSGAGKGGGGGKGFFGGKGHGGGGDDGGGFAGKGKGGGMAPGGVSGGFGGLQGAGWPPDQQIGGVGGCNSTLDWGANTGWGSGSFGGSVGGHAAQWEGRSDGGGRGRAAGGTRLSSTRNINVQQATRNWDITARVVYTKDERYPRTKVAVAIASRQDNMVKINIQDVKKAILVDQRPVPGTPSIRLEDMVLADSRGEILPDVWNESGQVAMPNSGEQNFLFASWQQGEAELREWQQQLAAEVEHAHGGNDEGDDGKTASFHGGGTEAPSIASQGAGYGYGDSAMDDAMNSFGVLLSTLSTL